MSINRPNPNTPRTRKILDTLCWLIEDAYNGDLSQSLLENLSAVRTEDWVALPPGGGRSIADILEHVGWCKWMYEDYAFGTASLRGDQPPQIPPGGARSRPPDELLRWLEEGHQKWLASVRSLQDDGELERQRLTNWGELLPTYTIIRIMIGHDFYHAGEINHLRSLLQGTDRWEYE
ncbi:MAG: DinB family protein [Acidobacteriaceae bacterium]